MLTSDYKIYLVRGAHQLLDSNYIGEIILLCLKKKKNIFNMFLIDQVIN